MKSHNILIMGPIGVGKSSVSKELALRTGKKLVEMDEERKRIYDDIGFSLEKCEEKYEKYGIMGWYQYQKPFELYSVKKLLEENEDAVIDFGGGQSVYDNEEQIKEFLDLMKPQRYSFLLMPYEDEKESLKLLNTRTKFNGENELNSIFVNSKTGGSAAKHIIYTGTKTVSEIADEIMKLL